MKKVQIIGAGQLGSRHLQALKAVSEPIQITVIDPSSDSLKVAKERYESVTQGTHHPAEFVTTIEPQSAPVDLVIIATNANTRRSVVEKLLASAQIRNLVLEKILFQNPEDYRAINELVSQKGTRAWVNCCMRQMPIYQKIRSTIQQAGSKGPIHFDVSGSQYGLITNAIHYFDYLAHLAGSTKFEVFTHGLEDRPIESKRKGFLEYNGTLTAVFENGSHGTVTCLPTGSAPTVVQVHTDTHRFIVRESERKVWFASSENNWQWSEMDAVIPYQSQLTGELAQMIFKDGNCPLPTLQESSEIHLALLEPLGRHLTKHGVTSKVAYPFT